MAAEDALRAAKEAALASLPTNQQVKRRRRKRRPQASDECNPSAPVKQNQSPSAEEATAEPDYEPDNVDTQLNITAGLDYAVADILPVLQRFAARGPALDDVLDSDDDLDDDVIDTDGHPNAAVTDAIVDGPAAEADGAAATDGQSLSAAASRKQVKALRRDHVTVLKSLAANPAAVDVWDVTARDAVLLTRLKSLRGTVAVPDNWRTRRKYLHGKRGVAKQPFRLPAFLAATGLPPAQDARRAAEDAKSLKRKQRDAMRGKLAVPDVDARRLRDAFFVHATRPPLTPLGDLYYELRELQVDARPFRPGRLSHALRDALGMTDDAPPPWLVAMQRWGPPPGWPRLRLPGLNAPLPRGASYGHQPGGWGRPPVDENGVPKYGDVFGEGLRACGFDERFDVGVEGASALWGEPRDDDDAEGDDALPADRAPSDDDDEDREAARPAPITSPVPPQRERESPTLDGAAAGPGYEVLREKRVWAGGAGSMMASSHVYELRDGRAAPSTQSPAADRVAGPGRAGRPDGDRRSGTDPPAWSS